MLNVQLYMYITIQIVWRCEKKTSETESVKKKFWWCGFVVHVHI